MDFSHYSDRPVRIAVDLVNTLEVRGGVERLESPDDLARFFVEHDEADRLAGWTLDDADLEQVRELRGRLRGVFLAGSEEEAAMRLNAILAESGATPRVSIHGEGPHLHFDPSDAGPVRWLATVAAMGLSVALCDGGWERFGRCASETCDDVFVDMSRNRSRRHCSDTCTTRENVAAFRRRRRGP